jgi:predicted nucleic acid-binding protein
VILVDTSVWIDFFRGRSTSAALAAALELAEVMIHPFVIGEISLENLGRRRSRVLADLRLLPSVPLLTEDEVFELVERRHLNGTGIGWIDAHLLASALAAGIGLWTLDRRLGRSAARLGVAAALAG